MEEYNERPQESPRSMSPENLNEILDKMLKLKEKEKHPPFLKKTVYIVASICVVILVIFICIVVYKNSFTTESILATLLAFFSIFISVFFYFKADETSSKFYDSSYKFMKDISVTLGKIEERFGEKLNSLNDKVSHLDKESKEMTAEIEDKQEDKDRIINELMEKANLSQEERSSYKDMLEKKDQEIELLRMYRMRAEREAATLRHKMENLSTVPKLTMQDDSYPEPSAQLGVSPQMLKYIVQNGELPDGVPMRVKRILKTNGIIDANGNISIENLVRFMNNSRDRFNG